MAPDESSGNPFALPGAPAPAAGWYDVNGCRLYAEVRGEGPPLLIIGAASDDAEMYRPIAEWLAGTAATTGPAESAPGSAPISGPGSAPISGPGSTPDSTPDSGFTVVTWDPRGTRRSSRDGWPCDSHTHAEDAAALLRRLGLAPAAVFGASAGGIIAVRLALRHPELVRQVLVYEPGFLRSTDAGTALLGRATDAVNDHLRDHPDDWAGALAAVARLAAPDRAANADCADDDTGPGRGPLDAPPGLEWYTERGAALADNFVRDDLPRTRESIDPAALRATNTDIRFAFGTGSSKVFRDIAETLSRARQRAGTPDPQLPDAIAGAAHLPYLTPEPIVGYIRARCLPEMPVA
jgi:pimeloyl-ACP methyl ester carboxylesterase